MKTIEQIIKEDAFTKEEITQSFINKEFPGFNGAKIMYCDWIDKKCFLCICMNKKQSEIYEFHYFENKKTFKCVRIKQSGESENVELNKEQKDFAQKMVITIKK